MIDEGPILVRWNGLSKTNDLPLKTKRNGLERAVKSQWYAGLVLWNTALLLRVRLSAYCVEDEDN
jgi:hypothetical protein